MFRFLRNKEKEVKVKKIQIGHCFNDKWTVFRYKTRHPPFALLGKRRINYSTSLLF